MVHCVYCCVHGITSDYLSELCSHPASHTAHHLDTVSVQSTETSLAVLPVKLSTYGGLCFSVSGPTLRNSLPDYLRDLIS